MTIGSEDTSHQRVSSVHNKWGSTSRWPGTAPGVPVHSDFGSTFLGFGDPNPGCSLGATNGTNRNAGEVELDWLETFLAVVDRGGFTVASAHVHRSQSRVSAHIAALERELGVRLIDRSHRPAAVTSAGRLFAGHARQILAEVGSARSAISCYEQVGRRDPGGPDDSVHRLDIVPRGIRRDSAQAARRAIRPVRERFSGW